MLERKGIDIKAAAYCLITAELGIHAFGGMYSGRTPEVAWAFADAILTLVPLAFGIELGLVCMVPFAASEILWFCKLQAAGPLLHLISFALAAVMLGLANRKMMQTPRLNRAVVGGALFELFLIGEEALCHGLRMLFLQKTFGWDDILGTLLSLANPVMLIALVLCCVGYSGLKDEKRPDAE